MKWSAAIAIVIASFGSVINALPTKLNNPDNLIPVESQEYQESGLVARGDTYCTPGNVAPINPVGGHGGGSFCGSKWPGPILPRTLTSYSKGNNIQGLELTYTDGSTERWGEGFNTQNSGSITLQPGELITSAWLAGNGVGTRLGKIHLVTNKGQTVDLGKSNAPNTYRSDVGSGLLIGIAGYVGKEIDSATLLFLKPKVTGVNIGNMRIDQGQLAAAQGKPATAAFTDRVHYFNNGNAGNQTFLFANSQTVTSTTSITQSTTTDFGFGVKVGVEFSIPEIVKVSAETSITWGISRETGESTTNSEAYTATYTQGGSLAPKTGVDCTAIIWKGSGTFSYTSTVTYHFDDGSNFAYEENGRLTTEQYSQGQSTCTPTTVQGAPADFKVGKTVAA